MHVTNTTTTNNNNSGSKNINSEEESTMKLNLKINSAPGQSDVENERSVVGDAVDKGPRSPFQREVREWQHIDPDTGALLTKRLEADRWINGPLNKYGKICDSQNVAQPNGTQHTKRKQLEVLQSRTNNGGALQVIRTQTSSRWSSASASPVTSTNTSPTIITTTEEEIRENGGNDDNNTTYLFHNNNNHHDHYHHNPHHNNNNEENSNSKDQTEITSTSYRPWPTSQTTETTMNAHAQTKAGADIDAGSNDLEICEVSDSEAADIRDIDCNGIVVVSDDEVNDDENYNNDDRDHAHNHDQDYERVFIHKVHVDADYQRAPCNNDNDNNNTNNHSMFNNLLETKPSVKLSNLMHSNSNTSCSSSSTATTTTIRANSDTKTGGFRNATAVGGKISLSALVEDYNNGSKINDDKNPTSSATATATATKITLRSGEKPENRESRRVFERNGIYGDNTNNNNTNNDNNNSIKKNNNKLISVKTRVGANAVTNVNIDGSSNSNSNSNSNSQQRRTTSVGGKTEEEGISVCTDEFRHCDKPKQQQQQQQPYRKSYIEAQFTPTQEQPQKNPNQLESFRLYNNHNSNNKNNGIAMSINGKPHVVVVPAVAATTNTADSDLGNINQLQRTHSMSTDDLSTSTNEDIPSEWQRMTKLRRSFQSNAKPTVSATNDLKLQTKRSDDLPSYKGSVARIRAELEQGRFSNSPTMKQNNDNLINTKRNSLLMADSLQEIRGKLKRLSDEALYKEEFLLKPRETATTPYRSKLSDLNEQPPSIKTNSLASRQKYRQSINEDWQSRRKSYGFEKMLPEDKEKNIQRMDASTDSGLGRSGDIGNWSPTTESTLTKPRSTVVHLTQKEPHPSDDDEVKRHSIAVDAPAQLSSLYKTSHSSHDNGKTLNVESINKSGGAGKRVEFCKTEVHFAAESGRVNIVETDGKPPPTQNFRRRRRTTSASGPLESLVSSSTTAVNNISASNSNCLPVTRFGDNEPTATTAYVPYKASLELSNKMETAAAAATATTAREALHQGENYRSNYMSSTSGNETTDCETDELSSLRGILKNKSLKPKPYHLGENIKSADALWRLPAVVSIQNESNLSNLKNYDSLPNPTTTTTTSVAERVRLVEKRQELGQTNGYSTRINLNISDNHKPDWANPGRRPSVQDKLLQDLRQHERTLDEGLKSTSLIMKTMRSASAFDEAMRRLSLTSEIIAEPTITTVPVNGYYEKPTINLAHITTSSITTNTLRKYSTDSCDTHILKLGNPGIPVSQQLAQLQLMYEMNGSQATEDSADEEVKSYFYDNSDASDSGAQDLSTRENDHGIVISGSWSRLKAKRTLRKMQNDTCLIHKEVPKSNVMSIELHSPQNTLKKPESINYMSSAPIAKPRRFFLHQRQAVPNHTSPVKVDKSSAETKEALKIVKEARGARKLREHELSYFGIQINNNSEPTNAAKTKQASTTHHKRHSFDKDLNITKTNLMRKDEHAKNWQLSDKPDLLNHHPILVDSYANKSFTAIRPAERKSLKPTKPLDSKNDHLYENIATELTPVFKIKEPISVYNRKTDTKRDAQILKEMSHNADNTLKAVSNELALKDQRRRSIRRQSTPLETINEKSIARKVNNTCVAVKVVRHRSPSKNPNSSRSRSSSISSDNSCTRMRTRSLSSERESTTGPKTTQYQTDGTSRRQRSTRSFHESRGLNSLEQFQRRPSTSGDESHTALRNVKTKRVCSTCNHPTTESIMQKGSKTINDKEKVSSSKDKSAVSTTHFSSRERAKCAKDTVQKPSSHRQAERDSKHPSSGKESRDTKRREDAPVQNSFRKFTSALGLGKSYPEKKMPTTSQSTESRSVARDKSHENNSRGHSNQVSASQSHERRKTTRNSSRDKKKISEPSPSDPMTTTEHQRSHGGATTENRRTTTTTIAMKSAAKHKRENK